jgi:hypothetical protein
MWNGKARLTHCLVLEQNDIEIESARSPSCSSDSAGRCFDLLELDEQIVR